MRNIFINFFPRTLARKPERRAVILYGIVTVLAIGYLFGTFFQPAPTGPQALEIGDTARAILKVTVVAPIILVWFLGVASILGSLRLSDTIANEDTKKRYRLFAYAILFLVSGLIAGIILGEIRSYYPDAAQVQRAMTILANYTYVFPPLVGFWLLYGSAHTDSKTAFGQNDVVAAVLSAIVGALWTGIIFTNAVRQTSLVAGVSPSFYLGDGVIVASIVIPTLLSWFFGIRSALAFSDVSVRNDKNRGAFSRMVLGIWLLIFSYIIILGLLSAGGERLFALGLGGILAAIYVFLLALLAAHWLIASGVEKLRPEESL